MLLAPFGNKRTCVEDPSHIVAVEFGILLPQGIQDALCLGDGCRRFPDSICPPIEVCEVIQRGGDRWQVRVRIGPGELSTDRERLAVSILRLMKALGVAVE